MNADALTILLQDEGAARGITHVDDDDLLAA